MSIEVAVRTLYCEDGVLGLNGYRYLLYEDGSLMRFEDKETATRFLLRHDINLDQVDFFNIATGELFDA